MLAEQPDHNPQQVRTKSLHLALDVDFRKCTPAGTVDFTVEVMEDGAASFDLDTRAHTIKGAKVEGQSVRHSARAKPIPVVGRGSRNLKTDFEVIEYGMKIQMLLQATSLAHVEQVTVGDRPVCRNAQNTNP